MKHLQALGRTGSSLCHSGNPLKQNGIGFCRSQKTEKLATAVKSWGTASTGGKTRGKNWKARRRSVFRKSAACFHLWPFATMGLTLEARKISREFLRPLRLRLSKPVPQRLLTRMI